MVQIRNRGNPRILVLAVTLLISLLRVSECNYLETEIAANSEAKAITAADFKSDSDQDADIFVAEIFPEGAGNFEQIFRPLARYRRAILGLDAQIEPVSDLKSSDTGQLSSNEAFISSAAKIKRTLPHGLENNPKTYVGDVQGNSVGIQRQNYVENRQILSRDHEMKISVTNSNQRFYNAPSRAPLKLDSYVQDYHNKPANSEIPGYSEYKSIAASNVQPQKKTMDGVVMQQKYAENARTVVEDGDLQSKWPINNESGNGIDDSEEQEEESDEMSSGVELESKDSNKTVKSINRSKEISNWGTTIEENGWNEIAKKDLPSQGNSQTGNNTIDEQETIHSTSSVFQNDTSRNFSKDSSQYTARNIVTNEYNAANGTPGDNSAYKEKLASVKIGQNHVESVYNTSHPNDMKRAPYNDFGQGLRETDDRTKEHAEVNGQPENEDKGSGEPENDGMYVDGESGDGNPATEIGSNIQISHRPAATAMGGSVTNMTLKKVSNPNTYFNWQSRAGYNMHGMRQPIKDTYKNGVSFENMKGVLQRKLAKTEPQNKTDNYDDVIRLNNSAFVSVKNNTDDRRVMVMAVKESTANASSQREDEETEKMNDEDATPSTSYNSSSEIPNETSVAENRNNNLRPGSNMINAIGYGDELNGKRNLSVIRENDRAQNVVHVTDNANLRWNKTLDNLKERAAGVKTGKKELETNTVNPKDGMMSTSTLSRAEAARKILLSSTNRQEDDKEEVDDDEDQGGDDDNFEKKEYGDDNTWKVEEENNNERHEQSNSKLKNMDYHTIDREGSKGGLGETDQGLRQSVKVYPSWSPNVVAKYNKENYVESLNHVNRHHVRLGTNKGIGNENDKNQISKSGKGKLRHNKGSQESSGALESDRHSHKRKRVEAPRRKAGRNESNFITMMMSLKARQLYKNLIQDTSMALTSKKVHHDKRNRQHHMKTKTTPHFDEKKVTSNRKHEKLHQINYATERSKTTADRKASDMKKLTTGLLNTMAKNDESLKKQATFSATKASEKANGKHATLEPLDSHHSLIEKLAELKYVGQERDNDKEVPIPETENLQDMSLNGPDFEKENPGKTVLQKQSSIGLGSNINMDSLDGSKEEYEFQNLNEKIEGELAENEIMGEKDKESSIGKITSSQFNMIHKNVKDLTGKTVAMPSTLSVYNSEESLEHEPAGYRSQENVPLDEKTGGESVSEEYKVNMTSSLPGMDQHENLNLKNKTKSEILRTQQQQQQQQQKSKWQARPALYFSGNSSLWKHHPVVSMDIEPLIDVFYKVNHKNLINLVEEEEHASMEKTQKKGSTMKKKKKLRKPDGVRQGNRSMRKNKSRKRIDTSKEYGSDKENKHPNKTKIKKLFPKTGKTIKPHLNIVYKTRKGMTKHKNTQEKPMLQHKYKRKHKKHVKGAAKFGIGEKMMQLNQPEIPEINNNMPANVKYYKIENAKRFGAFCIDGSTPGYYLREGKGADANKWIVHLHGGAWCYDAETCFRRSYSILGSTNHWSAENITNFFQGILSGRKDINPWFSDWTVAVLSYCDGGLFSGRRKEPLLYRGRKLYFRGRQILKATVESLKRRNLDKASEILLSGTSAGGLAVLLQGDYLRHRLPKTASVRGLVDAGFFLDSEAEDGSNVIGNQFKGLYSLHNPKLRKKCESVRDSNTKFQCLFPQYTIEHTKLPIYFVNALYDHWQLSELQKLHCIYNNDKCHPVQREKILNFRKAMFTKLKNAIARLPNAGLFADSCIGHGQVIVDYTWSRIRVNNSTVRDAFTDWLRDNKGEKRHIKADCHYPCNGSCPRAMVKSCVKNFKGTSNDQRTSELC